MRLVEGLEARCASYLQKGSKATLGRPMAPAGPTRRHDARQGRRINLPTLSSFYDQYNDFLG